MFRLTSTCFPACNKQKYKRYKIFYILFNVTCYNTLIVQLMWLQRTRYWISVCKLFKQFQHFNHQQLCQGPFTYQKKSSFSIWCSNFLTISVYRKREATPMIMHIPTGDWGSETFDRKVNPQSSVKCQHMSEL